MGSPSVLTNPIGIFDYFKKEFPNLKAEGFLDGDRAYLLLTIEHIHPFEIRQGLIVPELKKQIESVKSSLKLLQLGLGISEQTFDLSRVTVAENFQAREYYTLQRHFFKLEGGDIVSILLEHLEKQNQGALISRLGLSPEQIENELSPADFALFETAFERLQSKSENARKLVASNLQEQYPSVWARIAEKRIAHRAAKFAEKPSGYKTQLEILQQRVIGQQAALQATAAILADQQKTQITRPFLFVGPSGVGKTELAKAIASTKQNRLIFISMNQFTSAEGASSLFGSDAGYVGSTDRPYLAQQFQNFNPKSVNSGKQNTRKFEVANVVLLFDEIEKAHADVKQSLLTLFDEGYCEIKFSESRGNNQIEQYHLTNSFMICTSNLFQEEILEAFQAGLSTEKISEAFKNTNQVARIKNKFSPEFLNRVNVIPFGPIQRGEEYQKILKLKYTPYFEKTKKELELHEIRVADQQAFCEFLEEKLYGNGTDIRKVEQKLTQIRKAIHENEENWHGHEGLIVTLRVENDQLVGIASFYDEDFGVEISPGDESKVALLK